MTIKVSVTNFIKKNWQARRRGHHQAHMCHAQQWAASAHVVHCNCYWPQVAWCRVAAVAWPHGVDIGQHEERRHSGLWSATTWAAVSRVARQWCEDGSANVERPQGEGGEDARP